MEDIIVTQLIIYPVKSLRGIEVGHAEITSRGFKYDRRWMLVNEKNHFITQRQHPELSLVDVSLESESILIDAPGMETLVLPLEYPEDEILQVKVWGDTCNAHKGKDEWNQWFSLYLKSNTKIVFMDNETDRIVDQVYARNKNDIVSFADGFPFLLISEASLDDLNDRLLAKGEQKLNIKRFRPNIVVKGCEPFEEDSWKKIRINDVDFYPVKPCSRCIVTTIDYEKGKKGTEPLLTLMEYRRKDNQVFFGMNLVHDWQEGSQLELSTGQSVHRLK